MMRMATCEQVQQPFFPRVAAAAAACATRRRSRAPARPTESGGSTHVARARALRGAARCCASSYESVRDVSARARWPPRSTRQKRLILRLSANTCARRLYAASFWLHSKIDSSFGANLLAALSTIGQQNYRDEQAAARLVALVLRCVTRRRN